MKKDDLSQLLQAIHRVYVPPCLVIDSHYRLLYRFGDLDALLRLPTGAVTLDIRDLLPEELGTLVTAMLSKAQTGSDLVHRSLSATTDQGTRRFDLRACPLTLPGHGELVALFFEGLASEHRPHQALQSNALENELRQTRESLQATIEELEASNEEMHATNEELIAANEELQSTNEELQTVNDQLHVESAQTGDKLNELCDANGDMERLLAHLDVGLVVLDDQLVIRRFNPTATSHFNLLPQDVGRSLTQLSHRLRFDDLVTACQRALLEPPSPGWQTVQTDDGRALQLQLRSYEAQHTPLTTQSGRSLVIAIVAPPNP